MSEGDFVDAKKVVLGGYLHLLQELFWPRRGIRTSPGRNVLVWRRGGCGTGAILVAAFATTANRTMIFSVMR